MLTFTQIQAGKFRWHGFMFHGLDQLPRQRPGTDEQYRKYSKKKFFYKSPH